MHGHSNNDVPSAVLTTKVVVYSPAERVRPDPTEKAEC